jgi:hypothetical protein
VIDLGGEFSIYVSRFRSDVPIVLLRLCFGPGRIQLMRRANYVLLTQQYNLCHCGSLYMPNTRSD